ncbi:MAG: DUF4349 domain-containing protein [Spirochaetaceae bacterium]|nr:DUF4349 domain-containing protein [Spirochaetaceae bacterium]
MKSRIILSIMILSLLAQLPAFAETSNRRQTMDAVILVEDRFDTADKLEEWVDDNGGYLLSRVEDELILRVPSEKLEAFVDILESIADDVIQIRQMTEDIGQDILEAEAGIKSKTELFDRALVLIDQTDLSTTLEIEREVLSILRDIENLQGRYRKLLGEVELARVTVAFTLEEESLPQNLPSTFKWINAVDFYILMRDFQRN